MRQAGATPWGLPIALLGLLLGLGGPSLAEGAYRQTPDEFALSAPGAAWEVVLPGPGFTLQAAGPRRDGRGHYYFLAHAASGLNVSCTLGPATRCATGQACRDAFWRTPPPATQPAEAVQFGEVNGFATVEFLVPGFQGVPVRQFNVSAHQVRDGVWIDLHLSKVQFTPEDRATFIRYLEAVQVVPKPRAP